MSTSPSPHSNSSLLSPSSNATYLTDDESQEISLTEFETILLAGVLTVLPLILGLALYFGFKFCSGRLRKIDTKDSSKDNEKETFQERKASSNLLLPDQMKPSESQFSVLPVEEIEDALTSYSSGNHTSKSTANGSIITMTMKNNHLIVETEERAPEGENCQGGTGVFIVDVESRNEEDLTGDRAAIVHQAEEDDGLIGAQTGLSQSDLSSTGSTNATYSYGNQQEYWAELPIALEIALRSKIKSLQTDDDAYLEEQRKLGIGVNAQQDRSKEVPEATPQQVPGSTTTAVLNETPTPAVCTAPS